MSIHDFDPEILQDFITESGELLEQLESDLVDLESTPQEQDLLNQIFRALHTIKGSASFLAMTNLVSIAHVSESALNSARNGDVIIGSAEMDLLLAAVDVLKLQFSEITAGNLDLTAADPALIDSLSALGNGVQSLDAEDPENTPDSSNDTADLQESVISTPTHPDGRVESPLELDSSKLDLIEHLTADIEESLREVFEKIDMLRDDSTRSNALSELAGLTDELVKTIDFFDLPEMMEIMNELEQSIQNLAVYEDARFDQITPRLHGLCMLLSEQTSKLTEQVLVSWDTTVVVDRLRSWISGETVDGPTLSEDADGIEALRMDGIFFGDAEDQSDTQADPGAAQVIEAITSADECSIESTLDTTSALASGKRAEIGQIEQTIRVEVGRLESLMNLVGELVLQKNRIGALSEDIERTNLDSDLIEQMESTASTLDRVTGDIQLAVMRTRMQPLVKLFGKYPRLIRDLANKTDKKINLIIEGAETEVDKSVIEELGDPLVHLLRNSGDHGIELPADRIAAGKEETGTIRLIAGHAGSHVCVQIIDDGKGLDRDVIGAKAIERGLTTAEQLSTMPDEEVFRFILEAGFSTAEQVSDLSGRGVGMDVVRTNIESKLKGELTIESERGKGTTLTITIPLTVAIMPAMMIAVADEVFAIPLTNITEIVRPSADQLSYLGNDPVIHLRGQVYPLISAQEMFDVPHQSRDDENFVVVLSYNQRVVGLRVSSVIGQQEIVIKPLDGIQREGPISGATIRNDGSVSLIMDIAKLMSTTKSHPNQTNSLEPVAASGR
jgi:two-component system, chemotaxis family, sensor kinase CheA